MLRAEMPFKAEVHDRGVGPPVLVLSGHTVGLEGGATLHVTLEIGGLPGSRLDKLQDAIVRRLSLSGAGVISLLSSGEARGRPLLSLGAVEVPAGERQTDEHRGRARVGRLGSGVATDPWGHAVRPSADGRPST